MGNRINILHLRASNFYGGPERQIHQHALMNRLSEYNITVSSFTENGKIPEFIEIIKADNIPTFVFNVKNAYDPQAMRKVRQFLGEKKIDILCTHDYRTSIIGFFATRMTAVRWVAFSRGWTAENIKIKFYNLMDKFLIRFADNIVAVSEAQKNRLAKFLIPRGKILVAHNAIDLNRFQGLPRENLRHRFDLPAESIIVASAGRFSAEKGQRFMVKAAMKAVKQNKSLYFILFGNGPDREAIINFITDTGLADRIFCPGHEEKMISCLKDVDILVNPSLTEGMPNVVLEAMCLGVPVIATAVGGVPEVIMDGYNGSLVKAEDIDGLTRRIVALASDNQAAARFATNARETIETKFNFTEQNQKLTYLYRKLIGDRKIRKSHFSAAKSG